jgi:hypothetical protein
MSGIISGAVMASLVLIGILVTIVYCTQNSVRKPHTPVSISSILPKMELVQNPINPHVLVHVPPQASMHQALPQQPPLSQQQQPTLSQQQPALPQQQPALPQPEPPRFWTLASDGTDTWYVSPDGQSEWELPKGAQLAPS